MSQVHLLPMSLLRPGIYATCSVLIITRLPRVLLAGGAEGLRMPAGTRIDIFGSAPDAAAPHFWEHTWTIPRP